MADNGFVGGFGYWRGDGHGGVEKLGSSLPDGLEALPIFHGDAPLLAMAVFEPSGSARFRLHNPAALGASNRDGVRIEARAEQAKGAQMVVIGRAVGALDDRLVFATEEVIRAIPPIVEAGAQAVLQDESKDQGEDAADNIGTFAQDVRASVDQDAIAGGRAFPLPIYQDRSRDAGLPSLPPHIAAHHKRDEFPVVVTPHPEGVRASLFVSLTGGGFFAKIRDAQGRNLAAFVGPEAIGEVGQWAFENGISSVAMDGVLSAHNQDSGEPLSGAALKAALNGAVDDKGHVGAPGEKFFGTFTVLDLPMVDGVDLHKEPLATRLKRMKALRWLQSQGAANPRESFMNAGHHRYARTKAQLVEALDFAMSLRGAKGALVRSSLLPYPLDFKVNPDAGSLYRSGLVLAAKVSDANAESTEFGLTIPKGRARLTQNTSPDVLVGKFPAHALPAKAKAGDTIRLWADRIEVEESELGDVQSVKFVGLRPIAIGMPRRPEALDKLLRRARRRGALRDARNPFEVEWGERLIESEGYGQPGALAFAKRARVLESLEPIPVLPATQGMELGPGQHAHVLIRAKGKTQVDGAHRHIFLVDEDITIRGILLPAGSLLYTTNDGAHAHSMAARAEKVRSAGSSHTHQVMLPGGMLLETEDGGSHDHEAMVRITALDGGHRHVLVLGAERLESLGAGELSELAADPKTLFVRAPGPEMVEAAIRVTQEAPPDAALVEDDASLIPADEGAADFRVLAHWLREQLHHELLIVGPDEMAHGFDLVGGRPFSKPVTTASQARALLQDPGSLENFVWLVGYVPPADGQNPIRAIQREAKDRARLNIDGALDVHGEQHILIPVDSGRIWFGRQDAGMREFFVDGLALRGRVIMERVGEDFIFSRPFDQLPYVLGDAARAASFVPPVGRSMLPGPLRSGIPEDFQYWKDDDYSARAAKLEALRDAIEASGVVSELTEQSFSLIRSDVFAKLTNKSVDG